MANLKEFTIAEVKEHTTEKDIYVIIHDKVYDLSKFLKEVSKSKHNTIDDLGLFKCYELLTISNLFNDSLIELT